MGGPGESTTSVVTTASEESLGTAEEHAHPAGDGSARDAGRGAHCPQCGALLIAESPADAEQQALVADLAALEDAMLQLESLHGEQISRVHPDHRADAVNLTHYLALRQPPRAEVTDAAMAQRVERVMLNKGPHIDTAILFLDDILYRMSGHQRKRRRCCGRCTVGKMMLTLESDGWG